ncbi:hypothetical protein [uncultured Pseudacidovorax sp.]|uniref:hypothetical protein n=1 Tax=uncultured Pseudacidovorax sp. TaxID=679313 RepID=UPI0025D768E5|nr:hypothetical protein [uncultured Pseudacidovorax sp.]
MLPTLVIAAACFAAGVFAGAEWHGRFTQRTPACPTPPTQLALQAELDRTQLSRDQSEAARAALQDAANSCSAETDRMKAELRFLRSQRTP